MLHVAGCGCMLDVVICGDRARCALYEEFAFDSCGMLRVNAIIYHEV